MRAGSDHYPPSRSHSAPARADSGGRVCAQTLAFNRNSVSRSESRTDLDYGAGRQWMSSGMLGVRLEWERLKNIGRGSGAREGRDVDFRSAGLMVQF